LGRDPRKPLQLIETRGCSQITNDALFICGAILKAMYGCAVVQKLGGEVLGEDSAIRILSKRKLPKNIIK